ncbi:MAG: DUF1579 domain-containing protein [Planctomycetes bacterium]|nr:DUF1579 domain-containing protein [Planctomycetota bacterium]
MLSRTRLASLVLFLGLGTLAYAAIRPVFAPQDVPEATAEHKMLLKAVGEWEGKIVAEMPGAPAQDFPATETITAVGEFWVQSKFACNFMGMPFAGAGTTGYDVAKKKYVGTWIDSMTTELAVMEGTYDAEKKALVMSWEAPEMGTGERVPHRMETVHGADSYVSKMFVGKDGGQKTMEIHMKRKSQKDGAKGPAK